MTATTPRTFTSQFVDLDGPVHVADFGGEGGPPMLLVHGLGGSSLNWAAVGPLLATQRRVVAIDLIGFGRTPLQGRASTFRSHVELVSRFVWEELGEPAILVGNSMGGGVSTATAAEHPEAVRGVVLLGSALPPNRRAVPRLDAQHYLFPMLPPGVGELVLAGRRRFATPQSRVDRLFDLACVDPTRIPADIAEAHVAAMRERTPQEQRELDLSTLQSIRTIVRENLWAPKAWARAAEVRCPVLMLHGERDRLIPVTAAREAARRLPHWQLEVLLDIGHIPQLEAPEATAHAILRWLSDRGLAGTDPAQAAQRAARMHHPSSRSRGARQNAADD